MTAFDPEVAYRILSAKQLRLHDEASDLVWRAISGRVRNTLSYEQQRQLLDFADKLREEAYRLYKPLNYLQECMTETTND